MNNNNKILALFGKSGAGKDTIAKELCKNTNEFHQLISCTTRPKRDYEINGKDYFFISNDKYKELLNNNQFLEVTTFNNWNYGTLKQANNINKINVGVFNIQGIYNMLSNPLLINYRILPVYIYASDKIRLNRLFNREKYPNYKEICRRFLTDEEDFKDIPFYYTLYNNDNNEGQIKILNIPEIKEFCGCQY